MTTETTENQRNPMKILKEAVVLLIAAFLVISTAAVMANTKNIQIAILSVMILSCVRTMKVKQVSVLMF